MIGVYKSGPRESNWEEIKDAYNITVQWSVYGNKILRPFYLQSLTLWPHRLYCFPAKRNRVDENDGRDKIDRGEGGGGEGVTWFINCDMINSTGRRSSSSYGLLSTQCSTLDTRHKSYPAGKPNGVHLAPGPFGHPQGSYQFSGSSTSYIEIPNNGGLDTRYSITILAWLNQENDDGPIVNFGSDVWGFHFWVVNGRLFARPSRRADRAQQKNAFSSSLSRTWNYVGTSYNFSEVAHEISGSAEQKTQYDVRMGAKASNQRYLKGRICCLQIYNKSLSQQEIIAVQNRTLNTCKYDVS